jgi:two-component system, response regulator
VRLQKRGGRCSGGAQVLEYLFGEGEHAGRDPAAMPRLVVLDLNMPGMDGLEALGYIRDDERTRRLPVVMTSAFCTLEDVQDAYSLGANAFIDKASTSVPFEELVREVAHSWLAINEPPPTR